MNYKEDLKINKLALDDEWQRQSLLSMKYVKIHARAVNRVQKAEEALKIVKSELIAYAWEHPTDALGDNIKPTQQTVEAFFRKHDAHKEAKQELIDATFEANIAEGALKEISITRKAALAHLTSLHISNYYSDYTPQSDFNQKIKLKRKKDEG